MPFRAFTVQSPSASVILPQPFSVRGFSSRTAAAPALPFLVGGAAGGCITPPPPGGGGLLPPAAARPPRQKPPRQGQRQQPEWSGHEGLLFIGTAGTQGHRACRGTDQPGRNCKQA